MKIIQKVLIKQVITDQSKKTLYDSFIKEKNHLERECQQLLFEQRKLKNKLSGSKDDIHEKFEAEIEKRKNRIIMIEFQLEQLDILETGSEITEREAESLLEVQIGDDWNHISKVRSIVVEDGVVVRIDE